jgi:hypothetical protein
MIKRIYILIILILIIQSSVAIAQTSTIYFYRPKGVVFSNTTLIIAVNDTSKITLTNGSYQELKTNVATLDFITSIDNVGIKHLNIEKGKSYYIRAELKGLNSVNLILETEFAGKPAIERLKTDKEAKETHTENLKKVNVVDVVPLPEPKENEATIYLFRPFNVIAVTFIAKVTDGEYLYEMKNKSSCVITTSKEELNLKTVNEGASISNTSLKLKLEKGKVYYVAVIRNGGAVVLSEAKKDYAKQEMKLQ